MSAGFPLAETTDPVEPSLTLHNKSESNSSSEYGSKDDIGRSEQHEREVHDLVRKFTTQSQQHQLGSPFDAQQNSKLDPSSEHFRAKDWARSFYDLRYSSEETVARVAGVAFKSLDVWGKGSPTDFQATVGNKILKLPALFGRGTQKIEILRDLDGLILPGEQLCVLGPPGYVLPFSRVKRFINDYYFSVPDALPFSKPLRERHTDSKSVRSHT